MTTPQGTPDILFTPQQVEYIMDVRQKAIADYAKNDPVNTSGTASNLHGLNPWGTLGLFGMPGVDPNMYSTILNAAGSFSKAIPKFPTQIIQHRREILTGITDGVGTNPANFCGDPARPGNMKVCRHDFEFGEFAISSDTVEGPKVGAYYTTADMDRSIRPSQPVQRGPFAPDILNQATNPNSITWKQLNQMTHAINLSHEQVLWTGNKTAPATGTGAVRYFIKQPDGLERIVKTGYRDVVSQDLCTGADSRVVAFSANITGSSAISGNIVDIITDQYSGLMTDLGESMGYDIASSSWAIVMNPRMWQPLVRVWPCAYNTVGCDTLTNNNGERLNIDAATQRRMQDEMFTNRFLWIDGQRVPVLLSWGIPAPTVAADTYTGDIYIMPFALNGEQPLYIEYFNMANDQQTNWYNLLGPNPLTRVINGGQYRMGMKASPDCLEYLLKSMWRLNLDTPFAAVRITNITYQDRRRLRSPYAAESYYADGGVSTRGMYTY